jgi:hypothetical protein
MFFNLNPVSMKKPIFLLLTLILAVYSSIGQVYNGINNSLGNLYLLSSAKTRSISPENFTGEKGRGGMAKIGEGTASDAARDLGQGWKVNPFIVIEKGKTFTLAEINSSGAI